MGFLGLGSGLLNNWVKAWYISLLRYYAEKYRKNWYFYHNIVAVEPLNGMSLHSCAKSWLSKISDDDAIIDNVYCEILADKAHIRQTVQNIKNMNRVG